MSVLTGVISSHLFSLIEEELLAHEPQIQAVILQVLDKILGEVMLKIDERMKKNATN